MRALRRRTRRASLRTTRRTPRRRIADAQNRSPSHPTADKRGRAPPKTCIPPHHHAPLNCPQQAVGAMCQPPRVSPLKLRRAWLLARDWGRAHTTGARRSSVAILLALHRDRLDVLGHRLLLGRAQHGRPRVVPATRREGARAPRARARVRRALRSSRGRRAIEEPRGAPPDRNGSARERGQRDRRGVAARSSSSVSTDTWWDHDRRAPPG